MWHFLHKYLANGMLSRCKDRLVANDSTQLKGIDVDETFSLIVKPETIRMVLSLATSRHWPVHQLDKKYAVEILERVSMANCNPSRTPYDIESKLEPYFYALKRILRYVCGTLDYGLQLFSSSITYLVAYSDTDWAGCPTTRRLTLEAKYSGVANVVVERNLLRELYTSLSFAMLVYSDNVSAVYLSCNPVQHQRTKHIEIDIHFVRDLVAAGEVR
nr:ribonuclease H-like domain-containing protein [Tanacetum cinerariifolium]GEV91516.1 ribonuclease H-like domain-containing protein [Tanacetum cinerariifolium]